MSRARFKQKKDTKAAAIAAIVAMLLKDYGHEPNWEILDSPDWKEPSDLFERLELAYDEKEYDLSENTVRPNEVVLDELNDLTIEETAMQDQLRLFKPFIKNLGSAIVTFHEEKRGEYLVIVDPVKDTHDQVCYRDPSTGEAHSITPTTFFKRFKGGKITQLKKPKDIELQRRVLYPNPDAPAIEE